MMKGQGFDNRIRQAPEPQEIGPDFGVRSPEQGTLGFPHRCVLCLCLYQDGTVQIRKVRCENQLANVV